MNKYYKKIKHFCKKTNTPEASEIYYDVITNRIEMEELKDWNKQFYTLADEINMWYYDFEAKERKVLKNVKLTNKGNCGYAYNSFMKTNFKSTIDYPIDIEIKHNIRYITAQAGIDFGIDENLSFAPYFVYTTPHVFKKDNIDFSIFSHIYTITDISDDEVEIYGMTKERMFSILNPRKISPWAVSELEEV